jgi:hypothetical protein
MRFRLLLLSPMAVLYFSFLCAAQTPASMPQHQLPCYADKSNLPRPFQGFWKWKPNADKKPVEVTIGFSDNSTLRFPCTGEPLEITVPNGQSVQLHTKYSAEVVPCLPPTVTITPVTSDLPIAEALGIITKIGPFLAPKRPEELSYDLPLLKNKLLTLTSTCETSDKPALKFVQTVKITYQNPPRFAISAGLVASPGVKSFGLNTIQTGVGGNGVVTTQTSLAVTGSPSAQVIPFSFFNLYLTGSRVLNLNAQLGLGVNPNLSSPRVEFFAAPISVGWHDIYFAPGFHIGQHEKLTGGFRTGEITTLSKPPLGWSYYTGFGFSLSYNLKPLVKGASGK